MTRTLTNEDLTADLLENLLCTATFCSSYLAIHADKETREALKQKKIIHSSDCREDIWVKALLNGYTLNVIDYNAEGETYGTKGKLDQDGNGTYRITLQDIKNGLQAALSGTFNNTDDNSAAWATQCAEHLFDTDSCLFDLNAADTLLQIILFNEIIYG